MDRKITRTYHFGLDSQLLKFVRILGARTPYFSTSTVQRLNNVDQRMAVLVVHRGLDLGVFKKRVGQSAGYQLAAYDISHTSKG